MERTENYKLSTAKIWVLYLYFTLLFIIGVAGTIITLFFEDIIFLQEMSITMIAVIGGICSALVGNSIFYIRKVYKFCINGRFESPESKSEKINEIGIFFYFIARPLFAVGFSLLIHILLKSSVNFITVNETILNTDFIYLCMLLSFICGFATGDFITFLELKAKQIINNKINIL